MFYKAYNKFKPEINESNTESAQRCELIYAEINVLREKAKKERIKNRHNQDFTTPDNSPQRRLQNLVQNIDILNDYAYPNPDKPMTIQPHEVIMDTGAAMTMFPGTYQPAWKNLRPCLYSISGCFKGETHSDLQIGEFHGVMTMDSGETVRVIIPEFVQLSPNLSHSCLLANTPFLLAGHKYINDLYKPKLKLKNGGTYT